MEFKIPKYLAHCAGIYQIVDTSTNFFYLGSTTNFLVRYRQHYQKLQQQKHRNIKLQTLFLTTGTNLEFHLIQLTKKDNKKVRKIEQDWLNACYGTTKCLNMLKLATGGCTKELYALRSTASKRKSIEAARKANLGRKISFDVRSRMSIARTGLKRTIEQKKTLSNALKNHYIKSDKLKPFELFLDGKSVGIFKRRRDAWDKNKGGHLSHKSIRRLLQEADKEICGYTATFINKPVDKTSSISINN